MNKSNQQILQNTLKDKITSIVLSILLKNHCQNVTQLFNIPHVPLEVTTNVYQYIESVLKYPLRKIWHTRYLAKGVSRPLKKNRVVVGR
jgi:hypothetical protein